MHFGPQQLQHCLTQAGLPAGQLSPVPGGSLPAFRLTGGGHSWFVKVLPEADMAAAEADGLAALAQSPAVVPRVCLQCPAPTGALLVLQWLDLAPLTGADEVAFAEALAVLHGHAAPRFGWHRDNWIGQSRQSNVPHRHWHAFYRDQRLAVQLSAARLAGLPEAVADEIDWVMQHIGAWLDQDPVPGLLHGDLWQGNRAMAGGRPALFDPAVYHGDPLVDLAMLHLFGGPGASFWPAYSAIRPLDEARFRRLQPLYDLYHWLNHFTLFGESYLMPLQRCCAVLRLELRG